MDLVFTPSQIEIWPLDRLRPYARNAKIHGTDQVAKIAASMAKFGWTVPCMVADDGELIAGHGRVLAAIDLNYERSGPPSRATRIKQSVLGACRIRYLRCAPDHLPSIPELQLLVPQAATAARGPQPAHPYPANLASPIGRGLATPLERQE